MLRGAIFDMDGVLVDNMKVHTRAFIEFARRYGVVVSAEQLAAVAGKGNDDIFRQLFPADVVDRVGSGNLAAGKEALYREMYAPQLAPTPGLPALLERLEARGVKMAMGTSAMTVNLDFVLDGLHIRPRFDALVTADMVAHAKPAPEIYLRALAELGLAADECLVFEDAIAGIEAARAAEIRVVALATSIERSVLERIPGVVLAIDDFTGVDFDTLDALI